MSIIAKILLQNYNFEIDFTKKKNRHAYLGCIILATFEFLFVLTLSYFKIVWQELDEMHKMQSLVSRLVLRSHGQRAL